MIGFFWLGAEFSACLPYYPYSAAANKARVESKVDAAAGFFPIAIASWIGPISAAKLPGRVRINTGLLFPDRGARLLVGRISRVFRAARC